MGDCRDNTMVVCEGTKIKKSTDKLRSKIIKKTKQIAYIVDDDASVCRALKLLLEQHGFRVETFTRATKFLEFRHLKAPSCLVLDVRMPGMSGLALQSVMTDMQLNIPIVFITSFGTISVSVKAMKGGAIDFISKPFTEITSESAVKRTARCGRNTRKTNDPGRMEDNQPGARSAH